VSKVKGTVDGCGKGKYSYFITLDSKEGFYFNTKYEPKCGKGDVVGIEYEQKAENRGNVKRVEVLEKNSSGYEDTSSNSSDSSGGSSGSSGGAGGGGRQDSIVWQSSRKDALVLVGLLVSNDGIKLPAASKPDARRTIIEELIDEVTCKFFADASDPRKSKAFTTNAEIEADSDDGESDSEGEGEKKSEEWDSKGEWDD
jgi:hypothetical protein